jgi:hypothetical protein
MRFEKRIHLELDWVPFNHSYDKLFLCMIEGNLSHDACNSSQASLVCLTMFNASLYAINAFPCAAAIMQF